MSYTIDGRYVIVLGDKTTHGGEVITGSGNHTYFGKPVARVLDKVFCPKCGGVYEITEGAANAFDHGNRIAVDGCHTSCGAQLIAGFTRDQEAHVGTQAPVQTAVQTVAAAAGNSVAAASAPDWRDDPKYPRIESMPKAPPPLENYQMKPFHNQAEKQGLGDRKTLAQYQLVETGFSTGASNGWEKQVPINGEALVYVKNINGGPVGIVTPTVVEAGIVRKNTQTQTELLLYGKEYIFKFINEVNYWYISISSPVDVYMIQFEIWHRVTYGK